METNEPKITSLSHLENSPRDNKIIELVKRKWRGTRSFETSWWHVVTKLVEMAYDGSLSYPSRDGTNVPLLESELSPDWFARTKKQIMDILKIDEDDLWRAAVDAWVQTQMGRTFLYDKIEKVEKENWEKEKNTIRIPLKAIFWDAEQTQVIHVLERVDLLGNAPLDFDAEKIQLIKMEVLFFAGCNSFWNGLKEDEKPEFVMSKDELNGLIEHIIYIHIGKTESRRIDWLVAQLQRKIMGLMMIEDHVLSLFGRWRDIDRRQRVSRWL